MGTVTSRRHTLFAAASSVVIGSGITAGAAASIADLASPPATSPIIEAGVQIKRCWERHDVAEDLGDAPGAKAASQQKHWHEEFILASTPTTLAECALVLMIAVAEIDFGQNVDDGYDVIDAGERACERVARQMFALSGLEMSEFAAQFYVRPSSAATALAGRA